MRSLVLERIPLLDELLEIKQTQLDSFNDHKLKEGFPQYLSILQHDKESYLYNFYMLDFEYKCNENYLVNETSLWYAMNELKMIIDNIKKNHQSTDSELKRAFQLCANKVNEQIR
jgi:hypothetical protein